MKAYAYRVEQTVGRNHWVHFWVDENLNPQWGVSDKGGIPKEVEIIKDDRVEVNIVSMGVFEVKQCR
jgi:hypothetical protein